MLINTSKIILIKVFSDKEKAKTYFEFINPGQLHVCIWGRSNREFHITGARVDRRYKWWWSSFVHIPNEFLSLSLTDMVLFQNNKISPSVTFLFVTWTNELWTILWGYTCVYVLSCNHNILQYTLRFWLNVCKKSWQKYEVYVFLFLQIIIFRFQSVDF